MGEIRAAVIAGAVARGSHDAGARFRLNAIMELLGEHFSTTIVNDDIPDEQFDVVVGASWPALGRLRRLVGPTTKVWFDACDSTLDLRRSEVRVGQLSKAAALGRDLANARRLTPDLVTYISKADALADSRLWRESAVFPALWPTVALGESRHPQRIVMTGDGHYPPNRSAARWIARTLAPTLLDRGCYTHISVYGDGYGFPDTENVSFLGYASDAAQLFRKNDIHVAPVTTGAGVKSKVAIPMMAGLTVVTTPLGMRGLRPTSKATVVPLSGFANVIIRLLNTPIEWTGRYMPKDIHLDDETESIRARLRLWTAGRLRP